MKPSYHSSSKQREILMCVCMARAGTLAFRVYFWGYFALDAFGIRAGVSVRPAGAAAGFSEGYAAVYVGNHA